MNIKLPTCFSKRAFRVWVQGVNEDLILFVKYAIIEIRVSNGLFVSLLLIFCKKATI